MSGSPPGVLSPSETRAAEALLSEAWGEPVTVVTAEVIWDRAHVVRVRCGVGRSAVLKRRGDREHIGRGRGLGVEAAALAFLTDMPMAVAPRFLGADEGAGIVALEDLTPGPSLADTPLTGDWPRTRADLVAYATALAEIHAWSMGRTGEFAASWARYAPGRDQRPGWVGALAKRQAAFLETTHSLGIDTTGVAGDIGEVDRVLAGALYPGLVHGDACPDNVRLGPDGGCRVFDFETCGWGSVAVDAASLLAPFPTCWCFAELPDGVATPAYDAYRAVLGESGVTLGADWDVAVTAALASAAIMSGRAIAGALAQDDGWGTTTMRPRLLAWLGSFTDLAGETGAFGHLAACAATMREQLSARWPGLAVPRYPALARPGEAAVPVPEWWQPGL